jgi:hypothetical protein
VIQQGLLEWVFSVVVVGILINLASTALYPYVVKYLSSISSSFKMRNEKSKKDYLADLSIWKANPNAEILLMLRLVALSLIVVLSLILIIISFSTLTVIVNQADLTKFSTSLILSDPKSLVSIMFFAIWLAMAIGGGVFYLIGIRYLSRCSKLLRDVKHRDT